MAPRWQAAWRVIFKIHIIFSVQFERQKVDKKANLHENWSKQTILEYFEYFCQISSKSMLIILSYTTGPFFEIQCIHALNNWMSTYFVCQNESKFFLIWRVKDLQLHP